MQNWGGLGERLEATLAHRPDHLGCLADPLPQALGLRGCVGAGPHMDGGEDGLRGWALALRQSDSMGSALTVVS